MFIKQPFFLRSPDEPGTGGEAAGSEGGSPFNIADIENVLGIGGEDDGAGGPTEEEAAAAAAAEAEAAKKEEAEAAEAEAAKKAEDDAAAAAAAEAAAKKPAKRGKKAAAAEPEEDEIEPGWYDELELGVDLKKAASAYGSRDELLKALGISPEEDSDWRQSITDDKLKDHASRFASPTDMVKAHFDLRQQVSRAIVIPPRNATKEQMAEFTGKINKMMGVPESAEGYEFPTAEGETPTPEQEAARSSWAEFFHSHSVPKVTADALLAKFNEDVEAGKERVLEADQVFAEQEESALKREWGEDYQVNKTLAARAASRLFGEDIEDMKTATLQNGRLLLDSRFFLKVLAKMGREMSEGGLDTLSASEKEGLDKQVKDLREAQAAAEAKGDQREMNRLYKQEQEVLQKIAGKEPIVGDQGRAA